MPDAGEKPSRFRLALDFLKRLLGKKPSSPLETPTPIRWPWCVAAPKAAVALPLPRSKRIRTRVFLREEDRQKVFPRVLRGLSLGPLAV